MPDPPDQECVPACSLSSSPVVAPTSGVTASRLSVQLTARAVIYLLYVGETFGPVEATTLFFGVTKLFQHKDSALRQMVYLVIKELSTVADDVIMVTSSIMKARRRRSRLG